MNAALFEGAEVQLGAMLAAREARMAAQHGLIKKHGLPVVSFTLNIPGPVKRFALADMLFDSGVDMISRANSSASSAGPFNPSRAHLAKYGAVMHALSINV